ncbi:MAG: ABC transporter substrate-binding protein [Polyangia bacterium]|jgi:phospholipid transport system substrate-binding protein|nr:ABC transporter substrate-binding protein [Polyangia bacterium]
MTHRLQILLPGATAVLLLLGSALAQAGPLTELKAANGQLNKLAQARASDDQLKKFVNQLLDFDTMAENTLKAQWPSLSAEQKSEFKKLFQGLIEKSYISGIRKNASFSVDYQRETLSGSEARVFTIVHSVRKGRPRQSEVSYRMRRVGNKWRVIDMKTDDVSMEENYRNSFSRIIKDKGFTELLDKMRKKLTSA